MTKAQKWFEGKIDAIADLLRDGKTGEEIGKQFGVSRSAVIGLVNRRPELREIGFKRKPRQQYLEGEKKPRKSVAVSENRKHGGIRGGKVSANRLKRGTPKPKVEAVVFSGPHTAGLPLMMLGPRHCRWCINEPKPGEELHLFCAEVAPFEKPYCAYHTAQSIGAGTESERSAVRTALKMAA